MRCLEKQIFIAYSIVMDVSVVIVNFNTEAVLKTCLQSLFEQTHDIDFEVIVSDNGSTDGSIDMVKTEFPQVILIENNANLGFGAANNRAQSIAKGKYIFYLNSDTKLLNNAVKIFFDYWEQSPEKNSLGALGCNLLNPDEQTISNSYGDFFNFYGDLKLYIKDYLRLFKILKEEKKGDVTHEYYVGPVDIVIGADLFLLNNEFARFDEYFFLYHEESDLQLRLANQGKVRRLIEGPKIVHFEGQSNSGATLPYQNYVSFSRIQDRISRIKYYKKNRPHRYEYKILKFLVFLMWTFPPVISGTKKYWKELYAI